MRRSARGFSLIEVLMVIATVGILSGLLLVGVGKSRAKARDAQRLNDMHQLQTALELYRTSTGHYPDSDGAGCSGWDTPGDGTFLSTLATAKLLPNLRDPKSDDACGNYRYYRYPQGYDGCAESPFYVLQIVDMETVTGTYPASPGWKCATIDWQSGVEWAIGRYEQ